MKILGAAMFAAGIGCLAWAIVWGHDSAWSAAAMCFCASAVLFLQVQRRKPPEEG